MPEFNPLLPMPSFRRPAAARASKFPAPGARPLRRRSLRRRSLRRRSLRRRILGRPIPRRLAVGLTVLGMAVALWAGTLYGAAFLQDVRRGLLDSAAASAPQLAPVGLEIHIH